MFWEKVAWAMAPPVGGAGGAEGEGPGQLNVMWLFIAIMVIFWVVMIVPQRKQQQKHKERVAGLKKGDRVITTGGLYGTVVKSEEQSLTLCVSELGSTSSGKKKGSGAETSVNVQVSRAAIATVLESTKPEKPEKSQDS